MHHPDTTFRKDERTTGNHSWAKIKLRWKRDMARVQIVILSYKVLGA
jgi:hypothetical protein